LSFALVVHAVDVEQGDHVVGAERPFRALVSGERAELHAKVRGDVLQDQASLLAELPHPFAQILSADRLCELFSFGWHLGVLSSRGYAVWPARLVISSADAV
jgi:hypothetical protein